MILSDASRSEAAANGTIVGISTLQAEQTEGRSWYQLDGRRVDTPTQKGIYIQNGKKLIIK